ncbi:hypothetical protein VVD49_04630 [Uliginosibacterium sp. H3]|uniref:Lipoprotein n=1 Tax=Uliginosibacterium silvisoli TaxID=3114758 RepID=A0ABU6K1B9_9RHOO|nr:hypothetical protein [Uliginosibacterium sp. H3]
MRALAALSIAILASACTFSPPFEPARFLQIRPKAEGPALVQIALKNGPECTDTLDRLRYQFDNPSFPDTLASCGQTSESRRLPFKSTLRNGRLEIIFDIEADSLEHCLGAVAIALRGQASAPDTDVLRPCQKVADR